jgi:hypothetical protein
MTDAPERIWALIPPASPAMSGGWRDTVPPAHWGADAVEYRRADAPPTLAEAMTVPEVRALVEALVAARSDLFLQIEGRHGPKAAAQYPSILKADAALARLKGDTP